MKSSYRGYTMITLLLASLSGLAMGWLCDSSIGWRYPLFQVIGVFLGFWVGCLIRAVPQMAAPNEEEEKK